MITRSIPSSGPPATRQGIKIRYWLYGLAVSVAVPLLILLFMMVFEQEREVRRAARDTALRLADEAAEDLGRNYEEGRRLLDQIRARIEARPADDLCDPLFRFVDLFPQYEGLYLRDSSGSIICGSDEAMNSETPSVPADATASLDWLGEGWTLVIRRPVEVRGERLSLSLIQKRLLRAVPRDAVVTVIDRRGLVVARSLEPERWIGQSLRGNTVAETVLKERRGRMEALGIDGVARQYGFTELRPLGWLLYIGVPTEPIMAPLRSRMWRTAGLGFVILVVLGFVANALSRKISDPIRALGKATGSSVDEVLRVTQSLRGPREVEFLARSFGELMEARKEHERRLVDGENQLRALSDRLLNVQEEERSRISRAIHDDLGQAITALKMDVGGMCVLLDKDPGQVRRLGQRAADTLDHMLEGVQRISAELRPPSLDDLGLTAAIENEAALMEERTGIECALSIEPHDIRMGRHIETVTYRIIQEALTNVARHSNASRVEIRIRERESGFVLDIRDDGRGIAADELQSPTSLGLIGIRERASLVDGELSIDGIPDHGTIIVVKIPKRSESE